VSPPPRPRCTAQPTCAGGAPGHGVSGRVAALGPYPLAFRAGYHLRLECAHADGDSRAEERAHAGPLVIAVKGRERAVQRLTLRARVTGVEGRGPVGLELAAIDRDRAWLRTHGGQATRSIACSRHERKPKGAQQQQQRQQPLPPGTHAPPVTLTQRVGGAGADVETDGVGSVVKLQEGTGAAAGGRAIPGAHDQDVVGEGGRARHVARACITGGPGAVGVAVQPGGRDAACERWARSVVQRQSRLSPWSARHVR
jgi:hypothetical protein